MNNILVYCEQDGNSCARVSLELVSKASELAKTLREKTKNDIKVEAILIGNKLESISKEIISYGADEVFTVDDDKLKDYLTLPYTKITTDHVRKTEPQILLIGATTTGRDLAPRVASTLKVGLTADCTNLVIGDFKTKKAEYTDLLYQIRPAFGGNIIATIVNPETRPQMATVREGVMKLNEADNSRTGNITKIDYELSDSEFIVSIIKKHVEEKAVDLVSAPIIVAGGYGLGGKEGFKLIKELADAIGGTLAASRASVDAGWIDHDYQVGQTGVTVRPKLYIACGISGAVQHTAGMSQSNVIIAIDKDPDAPIMSLAHYGIVGDLYDVVPKMIKSFKNQLK